MGNSRQMNVIIILFLDFWMLVDYFTIISCGLHVPTLLPYHVNERFDF